MDSTFKESPGGALVLSRAAPIAVRSDSERLRDEIREAWLRAKRLRSGSRNTVAAYERDLSAFFAWCDERGLDVFEVFAPQVEQWAEDLSTLDNVGRYKSRTKPLGKATVSRMLSSVSSFYAYAGKHTHGRIGNPVELVERPAVDSESQTLGLSRAEVDALREVARKRGLRAYAMVQLLLGTGLRVSELCGADTGDLTRAGETDVLLVTRKGGKRARVPVPEAAARALRRYNRGRKGPLFLKDDGGRMTRRMVDWHLSTMARDAGITKRISPHSLRHTAATLALDAGASLRDVQVQMGHSRPDTTARYDRARRDLDNAAARALAEVIADDLSDVGE